MKSITGIVSKRKTGLKRQATYNSFFFEMLNFVRHLKQIQRVMYRACKWKSKTGKTTIDIKYPKYFSYKIFYKNYLCISTINNIGV